MFYLFRNLPKDSIMKLTFSLTLLVLCTNALSDNLNCLVIKKQICGIEGCSEATAPPERGEYIMIDKRNDILLLGTLDNSTKP